MKKDENWQVLETTMEYENPFMRITKSIVLRPNKNKDPYYVLDRRSNFSIAIPIDNKGFTYLVGQYRFPPRFYSWEFPMGVVTGKSSLDMAKGELQEETGITAKQWQQIGMFQVAPALTDQKAYVFIARELSFGSAMPEENEFIKVKKASFKEIEEMVKKGEILDGPTISALYFYKQTLT